MFKAWYKTVMKEVINDGYRLVSLWLGCYNVIYLDTFCDSSKNMASKGTYTPVIVNSAALKQ